MSEEDVTTSHTKAEMQVAAVEALLDRQQTMSTLGFDEEFVTIGIGEVRGALAEAAREWERIEQGLPPEYEYLDPMVQPPKEMLRDGQVWVWLAGSDTPHWEIKGTGVVFDAQ